MKKLIILLLILSPLFCMADNNPFNFNIYSERDNGISSNYKKKFKEAQAFIEQGYYESALELFLELDIEMDNPNLSYHIGLCYINVAVNKNLAIDYLSEATQGISLEAQGSYKDQNAPAETYFYLAKAYHMNNNFDMAIEYFEKYKSMLDESNQEMAAVVDHQIKMCETAKEFVNNPQDVEPVLLEGQINSKSSEYAIGYIAVEQAMVYASVKNQKLKNLNNQQNLYVSKYDEETGSWMEPEKYKTEQKRINTTMSNTNQIFFSKNGDIYSSSFIGGKWTEPMELGKNVNTKSNEIQACLSPTGTRLYFVSDREGGFGGYDIWYCERFGDKWGPAVNLGEMVNTEYDEVTPYVLSDGISLYYSSQGHNSMGGFDIFVSILYDGFWSESENVGYPVNTTEDELFYIITSDEKNAFYSTTKSNSKGKKDIYVIKY